MIREEKPQNSFVPDNLVYRPRKQFEEIIDIIIIVIVFALLAVIVCTFFVDFKIEAQIDWNDFTKDTLVLTVCTASLYILLRSLSMRKGRRTDAWRETRSKMQNIIDKIISSNLSPRASEYCLAWEKNKLRDDRNAVLSMTGISIEDFENKYCLYKRNELKQYFPELTDKQIKTIYSAMRIKRHRYNPDYLIGRRDAAMHYSGSPSEHLSAYAKNILCNVRTVLNCTVTGAFSIGLFSDFIFNYSTEALIACAIKIAIIAIFGVYGMVSGYNFATKTEVDDMMSRTDELLNFLSWCNKDKVAANDSNSL